MTLLKPLATIHLIYQLSVCFDNLATAYIYNSDALKNVTEETKASTIAMLSQMGVVNAAEVVNYRLGASESYAADTGKDLESATLSEITAFAKEADMSDITKASLAAYVIEKSMLQVLQSLHLLI